MINCMLFENMASYQNYNNTIILNGLSMLFFPIGPCCWPFLSTLLLPLPFSDLSSHHPPILTVVFLVFCNVFVSLSQIFSAISSLSFLPCVQGCSLWYNVWLGFNYRFHMSLYHNSHPHPKVPWLLPPFSSWIDSSPKHPTPHNLYYVLWALSSSGLMLPRLMVSAPGQVGLVAAGGRCYI